MGRKILAAGLLATAASSLHGQVIDLAAISAGSGFVVYGERILESSGVCVSGSGDVNGDGVGDLLVGAHFADGPGYARNSSGNLYVIFGGTPGPEVLVSGLQDEVGTDGFTIFGPAADRRIAASAAIVGDLNNDGLADILVGSAEEAYVVFGKSSSSNVDLATFSGGAGTEGFAIQPADAADSGRGCIGGAGDINGDGYLDLALGMEDGDGPSNARTTAGEAYVIFGKAAGFGGSIDLADIVSGDGTDGFVVYGAESLNRAGASVSASGDIDGDGFADLAIGSTRADGPANDLSRAGEACLVYGRSTFAASLDLAAIPGGSGSDGVVMYGLEENDMAAILPNTVLGDINGDGCDDLAVGASSSYGHANSSVGAGETYVVFGTPAVSAATYRTFARSGDAGAAFYSPSSRCWIDFADGSGPGLAGSSLQTVTLTRSNASIFPTTPATADVMWEITTDRTAWTSAAVTFKYTDAEIAGLVEGNLRLYKAPSAAGPWTELATTIDSARNTATATVSSFSFFALSDQAGLPVEVDSFGVE